MIGHVKLRLFTGWPNPEWTIRDTDARRLASVIANAQFIPTELRKPKARVGYRGITLTLVTGERAPNVFEIYDQWIVERRFGPDRFEPTFQLLQLVGEPPFVERPFEVVRLDASRQLERVIFNTMPAPVAEVIGHMTFAQISTQGPEVQIAGLNPPDTPKIGCANGPSAPGNQDWLTHAGYNNCYNYANDVLNTDEWASSALPGTLTKMPSTTVTATMRTKLRKAILADGLTRVAGDTVPAACPAANKHYIAVVVRHHPASVLVKDFHCLRLDTDGTWSHKDASGIPRNTDDAGANPNMGNVITDLTQARFDGDPVLVGVYRAKKNNAKIG